MRLLTLLTPDRVWTGLEAADRHGALVAVAERLASQLGVPAARLVEALEQREQLGSTAVGDGFAIPHCKYGGVKDIVVALAKLAEPVEFGAPDGEPVHVLFVVLSPPDQPAAHLQVLSQIARLLKDRELRRKLREAGDGTAMLELLRQAAEGQGT